MVKFIVLRRQRLRQEVVLFISSTIENCCVEMLIWMQVKSVAIFFSSSDKTISFRLNHSPRGIDSNAGSLSSWVEPRRNAPEEQPFLFNTRVCLCGLRFQFRIRSTNLLHVNPCHLADLKYVAHTTLDSILFVWCLEVYWNLIIFNSLQFFSFWCWQWCDTSLWWATDSHSTTEIVILLETWTLVNSLHVLVKVLAHSLADISSLFHSAVKSTVKKSNKKKQGHITHFEKVSKWEDFNIHTLLQSFDNNRIKILREMQFQVKMSSSLACEAPLHLVK